MNPRIAILTPSYNHKTFIWRALQSIACQSYSNRHCFVCDDHSSDGSHEEIIKNIRNDSRFSVFENRTNMWLHKTLFSLLQKVSSEFEYVCFLESDDMWTSITLEERVKYIKENKACVVVVDDFKTIDQDDKPSDSLLNLFKYRTRLHTWVNFIDKKISYLNPIKSFWSIMLGRDLLIENFPTSLNAWTTRFGMLDYLLWLSICYEHPIYYTWKKNLLYRVHANNLSWINNYNNSIENFNTLIKYCFNVDLIEWLLFQKHYYLALYDIFDNHGKNFFKYIIVMRKHHKGMYMMYVKLFILYVLQNIWIKLLWR